MSAEFTDAALAPELNSDDEGLVILATKQCEILTSPSSADRKVLEEQVANAKKDSTVVSAISTETGNNGDKVGNDNGNATQSLDTTPNSDTDALTDISNIVEPKEVELQQEEHQQQQDTMTFYLQKLQLYQTRVVTLWETYKRPLLGLVVALLFSSTGRYLCFCIVASMYYTVLRLVAIACGVGLGLGWASHVYDQLNDWTERHRNENVDFPTTPLRSRLGSSGGQRSLVRFSSNGGIPSSGSNINTGIGGNSNSMLVASNIGSGDEKWYVKLMRAAGYLVDEKLRRGQILKESTLQSAYQFDISGEKALNEMTSRCTSLPLCIQQPLSTFIEYIVRDYVGVWYGKIDPGCQYNDPALKGKDNDSNKQQTDSQRSKYARSMMYTLALTRPMPFLDRLYKSMVTVFVNLAMRVEHVNVFELALLKWTRVLSKTFQTYRTLREAVKTRKLAHEVHLHPVTPRRSRRGVYSTVDSSPRESSERSRSMSFANNIEITEMEVTKEFLVAGKLHRAITFGMDCPSLLFADASGAECGPKMDTTNDVLEHRLYKTGLVGECELDYNRIVAQRIIKALLPREDHTSSIISSLITELMAGCILGPIMGCFGPVYLNSWIVSGLGTSEASDNDASDTADSNDNSTSTRLDDLVGEPLFDTPTNNKSNLDGIDEIDGTTELGSMPQLKTTNGNGIECIEGMTPSNASTAELTEPDVLLGSLAASAPASKSITSGTLTAAGAGDKAGDIGNEITMQLSMALIGLQQFADFDECRAARESNMEDGVDWYASDCQEAALKLVLVIEAALSHGRCTYQNVSKTETPQEEEDANDEYFEDDLDESDQAVEVSLPDYESVTLSQILMEMTGDIDAFEERVARENALAAGKSRTLTHQDEHAESYKPTATEQSTLRTLIAAWLHSGQIFRVVSILIQAHATILSSYYVSQAFLRHAASSSGFVRQLRVLDGVSILVDTMAVLACPRLDEVGKDELRSLVRKSNNRSEHYGKGEVISPSSTVASLSVASAAAYMSSSSTTARHLTFRSNETFASSLRAERERRTQSWNSLFTNDTEEGVPIVCSPKKRTDQDVAVQRELHVLARIFYTGTNLIAIRDAARRKSSQELDTTSQSEQSDVTDVASATLLTVETASQRRRIEIPDDDSSFLLRAQPRPLNAVGVHRDQRNHEQSYKCYAATFEEPAIGVGSEHFNGGRFIRHCLIRYYPIDRTATIALQSEARRLDQRKHRGTIPDTITVGNSMRSTPFLSTDFLRERHLCQRWVPKGTTRSQSLLSSSVMEPTDFTSSPRSGKAIEFVFKHSFFERPVVNLSGNHFTVQDSAILGPHRADASSLEISDASLSLGLLTLGEALGDAGSVSGPKQELGVGRDGYPIIWMKFSRKQDDTNIEVKPYRLSYVRAALLIVSARQEAQLESLIACVRAGSAKKATKALTDARLKHVARLLDYASSEKKEKQTLLLRDLKLGVNHIDRDQLRRNGLLCPRYPTEIIDLSATVEDSVQAEEAKEMPLQGLTGTYYRIRCVAKCKLIAEETEMYDVASYRDEDGNLGEVFQEEWVVYRSFKDFQAFHKHLKNEVSNSESSGTAGSRLVGAASAAFTVSSLPGKNRQRKALIPSMSQATKVGTLGITKKSMLRRQECLNDYISYYLSPGHLLSRCPELLLFLGAFYPLPPTVLVGETMPSIADPLGRCRMSRLVLENSATLLDDTNSQEDGVPLPSKGITTREVSQSSMHSLGLIDEIADEVADSTGSKVDMIPAIKSKIDKVPLPLVRTRMFELLRFLFGFDKASFVRGRMLTALQTVSFAVTNQTEFRKLLYNLHTKFLSAEAVSELVQLGVNLLWPNGVFFTSAPPLSDDELKSQAEKARSLLHEKFPDALRAILGQELTKDGLNLFHEMLQNRLVVKSMAYMLFDLLWIQIFPELGDILACGTAIDVDTEL